eukprot:c15025_g1_i2.p1 GENE.c15025_g1_i2~~c15025_g1_i2.p1  ORF type:complete len:219 (+),score=45.03 c15025_g1_i2:272-928(+)
MVRDVLIEADPVLKLSDAIHDVEAFWELTDVIIKNIEVSKDPNLFKARDIMRRLRNRDLYKYCGGYMVPRENISTHTTVTAQDIVDHIRSTDRNGMSYGSLNLRVEDIIVHNLEINYGMRDKNPIDFCHFFKDWRSRDKFPIPKEKVSTLLVPELFCEKSVRVYCRTPTPERLLAITDALGRLVNARNLNHPDITPAKKRRRLDDSVPSPINDISPPL